VPAVTQKIVDLPQSRTGDDISTVNVGFDTGHTVNDAAHHVDAEIHYYSPFLVRLMKMHPQ
jgi:hypothetical protein